MSSFDRRTFMILGAAALAGCGFAPVYGPGGSAENLRGSVAVVGPANRDDFLFGAELEQRLGQPVAQRYTLNYGLSYTTEDVGISTAAAVTRYNLIGTADYVLTDDASGAVLASGQVDGFVGYSATTGSEPFAAAQEDARRRMGVILADKLVTRLSLLNL